MYIPSGLQSISPPLCYVFTCLHIIFCLPTDTAAIRRRLASEFVYVVSTVLYPKYLEERIIYIKELKNEDFYIKK
jgi:hypothetical protein